MFGAPRRRPTVARTSVSDITVRILTLDPMRVASVQAYGENPERDAWEKLQLWAEAKGFIDLPREHPVFGFNRPGPATDGKRHGYEFWIRVGPEITSEGPVVVKEVVGGRFAVMTHRGYPNPQVWKQLWDWVQSSSYRWRKTHELERIHEPLAPEGEVVFDLYLPIED